MTVSLPPLFSREEALNAGLSRRELDRKVKEHRLLRLAHGLYLDTTADISAEYVDFIAAQYMFGETAIIGGLTALFYHGLIDQPPQQIWVIVPSSTRTKDRKYRLIRTTARRDTGIEKHEYFQICDINRTIAEAFKFATKIGTIHAISAASRAIKEKKTTLPEIMAEARLLGYEKAVLKYWDAIVGIVETS